MSNAEIRQLYLAQVASIPKLNEEWIQQGFSAMERAEAAWRIRYEARLEARQRMENPYEVELLRTRDMAKYGNPDGPTFLHLVEQARAVGLNGDEVYEAIVIGSYKTNEGLNKTLGF